MSNQNTTHTPTCVELFAGGGGLALGLHKAGFNTLGLVEIDKYATKTLRHNMPQWNVIEGDIVDIVGKGIKDYLPNETVDLVSGGYPCQAFSYAGNQKGFEDIRGTMFFYYAEVLKQLTPKVFLAENVKGLLTHDKGNTFKTMCHIFENLGYTISYKVLNANDYNVAQKRERLVIIGVRKGIEIPFIWPDPQEHKPTLRECLENVPKSEGMNYSETKKRVLELVPEGGNWKSLSPEVAQSYMGASYGNTKGGQTGVARRLAWDAPSVTLLCSPTQKQTERCHPSETRPLTIREYARIQSFPDSWEFQGSIAQQYKQIGNAVPVELAKSIGMALNNLLEKI